MRDIYLIYANQKLYKTDISSLLDMNHVPVGADAVGSVRVCFLTYSEYHLWWCAADKAYNLEKLLHPQAPVPKWKFQSRRLRDLAIAQGLLDPERLKYLR